MPPKPTVRRLCVVVLFAWAGVVRANTLLVPSQYETIQAAMDAAIAGDEVVIADGTYTGPGNRALDFAGKAVTVRSASDNPATCIINGQGGRCGFYFHSGEGPGSVVQGLTIRNVSTDVGGGVYCSSSSPTIANCVITENTASFSSYGWAGGVYCHASSPVLTNCIISGNTAEDYGGGLCCHSSSNPTLTNCTISGNTAGACGGGLDCESSSPTLTNCTISGNTAGVLGVGYHGKGGGIYCHNYSSPTLITCTIDSNTTSGEYSFAGGVGCDEHSSPTLTDCAINTNTCQGLYAEAGGLGCANYSSPVLTRCMVSGNLCFSGMGNGPGGGIFCYSQSNATLIDCTIRVNEASSGGGVSFNDCSPTLSNCTITQNVSTGPSESAYCGGGGVECTYSNATFVNCRISENTAYVMSGHLGDGGGICSLESDPILVNCIISANTVTGSNEGVGCGGGLYSVWSNPNLVNCTISGNNASALGGGVYGYSGATLTNCILWNDTPQEIYPPSGASVMTYCNVQGGYTGTGNINVDPAFVGAGDGDYRLAPDSPCIDAGKNSSVPSSVLTDFDDYPRFVDDPVTPDCQYVPGTCGTSPIVDMGAHEHQVATGACCTGTSCSVTTQANCAGTWTSGGTCSPNPCQTGSCCVGTSCSVTTQANCAGTWTSGGTCSPNPCQTGSCCVGTSCSVTTQANCAGTWTSGGTCSPNPCQTGSCCVGTSCSVTTQANCAGAWASGGTCTPNPCYAGNQGPYALACGTNGSGAVTVDPPGGFYEKGTVVHLQAVPATGWSFVEWIGDASGSESSYNLIMDGPRTAIARFAEVVRPPASTPAFNLCGLGGVHASLAGVLVLLLGSPIARSVFHPRSKHP